MFNYRGESWTRLIPAEFGESKEDKCRRLAAELSAIQQERGESVEVCVQIQEATASAGETWRKDCKRLSYLCYFTFYF